MGKIKDIFSGKYGSLLRFSLACLAVFLVFWLLGPGNTFIGWIQARHEVSLMDRQIKDLENSVKSMDSSIEDLTTNRDSLEKFAREHFRFAAHGEDVYLLPSAE